MSSKVLNEAAGELNMKKKVFIAGACLSGLVLGSSLAAFYPIGAGVNLYSLVLNLALIVPIMFLNYFRSESGSVKRVYFITFFEVISLLIDTWVPLSSQKTGCFTAYWQLWQSCISNQICSKVNIQSSFWWLSMSLFGIISALITTRGLALIT